MKYLFVFVIFVVFVSYCMAAISEPVAASLYDEEDAAVAEKKTEKRGIYGFGYGHGYGGYGYGGYGHAHYGSYGYGSPFYSGYSIHAPYGHHHGYYPYHHHGLYNYY
ncbi:prisilkin-39 [Scaptodrosophila lebanonensis]|uniref:Prisilkin-39 n=1 Tax=Drosophila lebanonensis TaxID=7225 RepID=A0A6J2U1W9_DROLE|nr:prisilkin-39 [Scaptodrosophila lebanonensis]